MVFDLMLYYLTNGVSAGIFLDGYPSLWWIAATVFAVTTVVYAVRFLRRGTPARPVKPWMKRRGWIVFELFTAVLGVALDGWMSATMGYIHFGLIVVAAALLFPTILHSQSDSEAKMTQEGSADTDDSCDDP